VVSSCKFFWHYISSLPPLLLHLTFRDLMTVTILDNTENVWLRHFLSPPPPLHHNDTHSSSCLSGLFHCRTKSQIWNFVLHILDDPVSWPRLAERHRRGYVYMPPAGYEPKDRRSLTSRYHSPRYVSSFGWNVLRSILFSDTLNLCAIPTEHPESKVSRLCSATGL
jgi:hypothetical protein